MFRKRLTFLLACLIPFAASLNAASLRWVAFDEAKAQGSAMEIKVLRADVSQITLHVSVPGMWVQDTIVEGVTFQRIHVPGMPGRLAQVGSPELPKKSRFFALPPSAGAALKVSNVKHRVLTDYLVFPEQGNDGERFCINPQAYTNDSYFPRCTDSVGEPAVMRNVRMGKAFFCPFQYNSARRILKVAAEFNVTISFSELDTRHDITGFPASVAPHIDGICRAVLLGYDGVYGRSAALSTWDNTYGRHYLVLTASAWLADSASNRLGEYIDWLRRKGYGVTVETATGNAENVWNTIRLWYDNWLNEHGGTHYLYLDLYVLLVGDAQDENLSPTLCNNSCIATYHDTTYISLGPNDSCEDFYSDYIYSTMGEAVEYPDNLDDIPDLAVGRWCPQTNADLSNVITKQFDFERYVADDWATEDVLFTAPKSTVYSDPKDTIIDHLLYQDLDCQIVYYGTNQPYANRAEAKLPVKNALQGDGVSVMNYRGHGCWYGLDPSMDPGDPTALFDCRDVAQLLNDGCYPMVFNVCCDAGRITQPPHSSWPFYPDTPRVMVEAWTNNVHGAVGAWGASCPTNTLNNNLLDTCLFKGLYKPDGWCALRLYDVGYGINYAKTKLIEDPPTETYALQDARAYYWIGDPGLWAWEDRVAESSDMTITVTIGSETFVNPDTLPINTEIAVELELTWTDGDSSGYEVYTDASLYKKEGPVDFIQHQVSDIGQVAFNGATFEYPGWLYITVLRPRDEPGSGSPFAMTPIEDSIYFKNMGLNSDVEEPVQPIVWSVSCNRTIFSNRVAFNYSTPQIGQVSLELYDASGRLLTAFNRVHEAAGYYEFIWDGKDRNNARLPSGVYFFIFEGEGCYKQEGYRKQGKVTLLR